MNTSPGTHLAALSRRRLAVFAWGMVMALASLASLAAALMQLFAIGSRGLALADIAVVARADRVALITNSVGLLVALTGLVVLARWIHASYEIASERGVAGLPMSASRAAWGFVLPVVQLWTPWRALTGLSRALDAALSVAPEPRAASDASGHYRDNAAEASPVRPSRSRAPINAAIGLWWFGQLTSFAVSYLRPHAMTETMLRRTIWIDLASQVSIVFAALLFIEVAMRLTARVAELAEKPA